MKKPERLSRRLIYKSPWVTLYCDRVRLPGGRLVPRHHVVSFERDGVAAIVTDRRNRILLIQSYRYTTGNLSWEVPAGNREPGESILRTARRETLEETGYETREHKKIYSYFPMNGISDGKFHTVFCRAGKKTSAPDPDEVRAVRWAGKREIRDMIRKHQIQDGCSLTALLLYFQFEDGRRKIL